MSSEYLLGTIEQIVYYSPDNGYTVCKFQLENNDCITIVGNFPPLSPGEMLKINGEWEINPRFGKQLRIKDYASVMPSSLKGIEKFLSSGLIKGIGPELARRIMERFGADTLKVLDEKPAELKKVMGIADIKLRDIKKSWAEHKSVSNLIVFLQDYGITTNLATKIYRHYGEKSFQILKTNPYQACHDIWGIGFRTADQVALKLGMSPESIERVKAYIRYLLEKDNEHGHVFSLESELKTACGKELQVGQDRVSEALSVLIREKRIIAESRNNDTAVYLPFFNKAENEVAAFILDLAKFPVLEPDFDMSQTMASVEKELKIRFSEMQQKAVQESLLKKILIITGGPGTGKTTIIRAVVDIFNRWGKRVGLAAPTGRAAQRLAEATGREAKTLHRTLEYNPKKGEFRRGEAHPLEGDALIIDEFSMVDLPLMFHLLKAVPRWMRLILVGDKDQLPSVGPGNLLHDFIESGVVEVVRLNEIFRQEEGSLIIRNAHRINQGLPLIKAEQGDKDSDFYFLRQEDEKKVFEMIVDLCARRVPDKLNLPSLSPMIQVISPMYRGLVGVDNLNSELQKRLNPHEEGLRFGSREIRKGDKVMQVRNNYDKEVFNGDIGTVADLNRRTYRVYVGFDGRLIEYEREEMNELTLAYAVSVHKSQGSEYTAVIMPLMTQHYIMLQRNLFYTALTRAKKLSLIVGSVKALHIAIKNDKPVKRNCLLKEKLIRYHSTGNTFEFPD